MSRLFWFNNRIGPNIALKSDLRTSQAIQEREGENYYHLVVFGHQTSTKFIIPIFSPEKNVQDFCSQVYVPMCFVLFMAMNKCRSYSKHNIAS
jgi:hypothetical protein